MSTDELRALAAGKLRAIGHSFVARDLTDQQLGELLTHLDAVADLVEDAPVRVRTVDPEAASRFAMHAPEQSSPTSRQLFADSIVSGVANPLGVGAELWREDDLAIMRVTLGKAFEGAPGRAHGGVIAALIDETMGVVLGIASVLAFTAQLDITYRAPTPIDHPIEVTAWLSKHEGRKLSIEAKVQDGETLIASATALFISVDPQAFLEKIIASNS